MGRFREKMHGRTRRKVCVEHAEKHDGKHDRNGHDWTTGRIWLCVCTKKYFAFYRIYFTDLLQKDARIRHCTGYRIETLLYIAEARKKNCRQDEKILVAGRFAFRIQNKYCQPRDNYVKKHCRADAIGILGQGLSKFRLSFTKPKIYSRLIGATYLKKMRNSLISQDALPRTAVNFHEILIH